ncbi:hypothetical protein EUGRSUZ_I01047 [Eucalyptus grandis]|uniref:Uncharacterized protein n=2 Tax=Eucalyptus grandis TaxID=71139 RepID=A0ACC3JDW2_EUCGR|nr:hypothetical protein EUGRSUZ_I01047 [Eucalyptus grandis]
MKLTCPSSFTPPLSLSLLSPFFFFPFLSSSLSKLRISPYISTPLLSTKTGMWARVHMHMRASTYSNTCLHVHTDFKPQMLFRNLHPPTPNFKYCRLVLFPTFRVLSYSLSSSRWFF